MSSKLLADWQAEARELGLDDTGGRNAIRDRIKAHKADADPLAGVEPHKVLGTPKPPDRTTPPAGPLDGIGELELTELKRDAGNLDLTPERLIELREASVDVEAYANACRNNGHDWPQGEGELVAALPCQRCGLPRNLVEEEPVEPPPAPPAKPAAKPKAPAKPKDDDPPAEATPWLEPELVAEGLARYARARTAGGNGTVVMAVDAEGEPAESVTADIDAETIVAWRQAVAMATLLNLAPVIVIVETTAAAVYLADPTVEERLIVDF